VRGRRRRELERVVELACAAVFDHIGDGFGAGPARDALEGFERRLDSELPPLDLGAVVDRALRGDR